MKDEEKTYALRGRSTTELRDLVVTLRKEQFNIRFQLANGISEGVGRLAIIRKTIARLKTIMAEQKRGLAA